MMTIKDEKKKAGQFSNLFSSLAPYQQRKIIIRFLIFLVGLSSLCLFCFVYASVFPVISKPFKATRTSAFEIDVFTLQSQPVIQTLTQTLTQTFTMKSLPINRKGKNKKVILNIYKLDQIVALNQQLNKGVLLISQNKRFEGRDAVIQNVKNYVKKSIYENQKIYQHNIEGMQKAEQFHLTQLPAIVFNHRFIVLGTTDLNRASEAYEAYLNQANDWANDHRDQSINRLFKVKTNPKETRHDYF